MPENAARTGPAPGTAGGFTIIEILVTVVVIAIGCLAALWMQSAAMRGRAQSDHYSVATALAETELERLKSLSFATLTQEMAEYGDCPSKYNPCLRDEEHSLKLDRPCKGQALDRFGDVQPADEEYDPKRWPYVRTTHYYSQQPTSLSSQVEVKVEWEDAQGKCRWVLYTAALTSLSLSGD